MGIYKTEASRELVLAAYDRSVERLAVEFERRTVETRFGPTHVLVAGPGDGPPLVNFHGGNSFNADTLSWFLPLTENFRMFAPDTIGHPGRSAEVRLSPKDLSYGEWAADVIAALDLQRTAVMGTSYGAGICLRLAAVAPERIQHMVLVHPAGLVNPPVWPMLSKLLWPFLRFRMSGKREHIAGMLQPLFGDAPVDEEAIDTLELVFAHLVPENRMPRPATKAELEGFTAQTLVIAGEHDVLFRRALERASEVIPNVTTHLFRDCGHYPPPDRRAELAQRVSDFLQA